MNLQAVLYLLPGDEVIITKRSREMGGQYARSLIHALKDNQPYFIDKIDKVIHEDEKLDRTTVIRASIYLKGFAGLRLDPASFEVYKRK